MARRRNAAEYGDDRRGCRTDDLERRKRVIGARRAGRSKVLCLVQQRHANVPQSDRAEKEKTPVLSEDRGDRSSVISMRYDTRGRPPAPPVRDSAAITIRVFRALRMCIEIEREAREGLMLQKNESPGRQDAAGRIAF